MISIKNLRWLIITLVGLATVINYIDRSALSVMWPGIAADLGLDKQDCNCLFNWLCHRAIIVR
jgi:MFS transporter, ACS family, hexuronate transporter